MYCIKCGVKFHWSDILVTEPGEELICDDCETEEYEKDKGIS